MKKIASYQSKWLRNEIVLLTPYSEALCGPQLSDEETSRGPPFKPFMSAGPLWVTHHHGA